MTNLQTAIEAQIERALDEVSRLCKPGERFRMSIPANREHDSDLIIADALVSARTALRSADQAQPASPPIPTQHEISEWLKDFPGGMGLGLRVKVARLLTARLGGSHE